MPFNSATTETKMFMTDEAGRGGMRHENSETSCALDRTFLVFTTKALQDNARNCFDIGESNIIQSKNETVKQQENI